MVPGLRLALSWLTVLPVRVGTVDRAVGRTAIAVAPVVGLLLGGVAAGLLVLLDLMGVPGLLAGILTVAVLAVGTRGLHLDGLADTADGLGCYGPPERALTVMRDGGVGPFGVVTLVLALGAQAAALGALTDRWFAVVLAVTVGRAAFTLCCRQGVPAARPDGLGALVAGTQSTAVPILWLGGLLLVSPLVDPDEDAWVGPVAVLLAIGLVLALVHHTRRRFGGIMGDVLGAASELAATVVLVTCTLG